jgi:hypothetical protein
MADLGEQEPDDVEIVARRQVEMEGVLGQTVTAMANRHFGDVGAERSDARCHRTEGAWPVGQSEGQHDVFTRRTGHVSNDPADLGRVSVVSVNTS